MNLYAPDFPQEVLDKLMEALVANNVAFIKFENTPRGIFLEVVTAEDLQKQEPHCTTCQCNRVHPVMPLDANGNPRKRSWHSD